MAVKSPCTDECSVNRKSKICISCFRTIDEIRGWEKMTDHRRHQVLRERGRRAAKLAASAIAVAAVCLLFAPLPCGAHAIAGNRFFPGTTTFDDPAVADEFQVIYDTVRTPLGNGRVTDHVGDFQFARLLTDRIAIGAESGAIERSWGSAKQTGAMGTSVNLKANFYRDDLNETLFATSLTYAIANSGSARVGARTPSSLQPALFAGQGLGNLPETVAWLRPLGFVGAAAVEFPMRGSTASLDYDDGRTVSMAERSRTPATLHTGFAVEYSTLYLTDRFVPGRLPDEEPLFQVLPVVEFAFDSPQGEKSRGTVNPGLSYIHDEWQISAEAVVPLSRLAGGGVGFRLQVLTFLDKIVPGFAEPIFGR